MFLIITKTVQKKELDPLKAIFPRSLLLSSAKRVARGLGVPIGGHAGSVLTKLYITSVTSAGRSLWAVRPSTGEIVLLLMRKKDDPIGENMSMKSKFFIAEVEKAFSLLQKDVDADDFEVIEL